MIDSFRIVFRIKTVRRLVFGQTVLFSAFAGFFAFGTLFFARVYFTDEPLFTVDGTASSAGFGAGRGRRSSSPVPASSPSGSPRSWPTKIDERFAATQPVAARHRVAVVALIAGFIEPRWSS